jgi:hypothetical protein
LLALVVEASKRGADASSAAGPGAGAAAWLGALLCMCNDDSSQYKKRK